ncbi:MAG: MarR family transcriptional regulator [Cyanobacteria bacterium P01_D01_bin.71]
MVSDPVDKILMQWQQERPDLDASAMGIIGRFARLAKHFERALQATFAEFDLRPGEFDVLATLRRSGPPYQLSPTALFNSMMVSSGTMTHRLDRLEKSGLVQRQPDPCDRRSTLIQLTDKGFDLIEMAVEAHIKNMDRLLKDLDAVEFEALANLLRKLLLSLEA